MPSPQATDEALIVRAREGDEEAFRLLVARHTPGLRTRIRRRLPALLRRKVAESDVIQSAYFTAYEKLAEFEDRGDGSFKAWLDRIVHWPHPAHTRSFRGPCILLLPLTCSGRHPARNGPSPSV